MVSDEAVLSVDLRALTKADQMDLSSAYLMASKKAVYWDSMQAES